MRSTTRFHAKTLEFMSSRITTPAMEDALAGLSRTHLTVSGGDPRAYLLVGPSGTGKTFTLEQYRADHAPDDPDEPHPIIRCTLDTSPTKKGLLKTIMQELVGRIDAEAMTRGTEADIFARLQDIVRQNGTEMIMVDESQHMLNNRIDRRKRQVLADTFKALIDATGVPFVLCGQVSIVTLLKDTGDPTEDNQLIRRTAGVGQLMPLKCDEQWESVVRQVVDNVPMRAPNICTPTNIQRLHIATEGKIDGLMELFKWAIEAAHSRKQLTMDDLASAFRMLPLHWVAEIDPFSAAAKTVRNHVAA